MKFEIKFLLLIIVLTLIASGFFVIPIGIFSKLPWWGIIILYLLVWVIIWVIIGITSLITWLLFNIFIK